MRRGKENSRLILYPTKIDWWIVFIIVFILVLCLAILLVVGIEWYVVLILGVVLSGFMANSCFEIYYVIKEDELGVKSNFKWMWYPIENIKEVRKIKSILAAPAMSFTRVSIKFERGTTKTAVPLEISPKDRDKFIKDLLKINPDIKLIQ